MDVGSIGAIALNEKDQTKINFAIQQLIARNSGAQINAVVAKSTAYTLGPSDFMVEVTGNTTITLPAASAAPGQLYCIKKMDSAATTATIGGTVDGTVNPTITVQYEVWLIQSSGTAWDRIIKYTAPVSTAGLLLNTNNLSDVSNVVTSLSNLGGAPLASPAFTGNPTASTQSPGNNSTRLATTAYTDAAVAALSITGRLSAGTPLVLNPYTASASSTQAHGLGTSPIYVDYRWECLSADLEYSAGDLIWGPPGLFALTVAGDATNLVVVRSAQAIRFVTKTTFVLTTNADNTKWKLTLTPYKLI